MAQKQGGKGKSSSPSRQASHKRGPARTAANKEKKMASHARRQGLNKAQMALACGRPEFPRLRVSRPAERVTFQSPIKANFAGLPVHILRVSGVVTEISLHRADVEKAKGETHSKLGFSHGLLSPLTGRQYLIQARSAN